MSVPDYIDEIRGACDAAEDDAAEGGDTALAALALGNAVSSIIGDWLTKNAATSTTTNNPTTPTTAGVVIDLARVRQINGASGQMTTVTNIEHARQMKEIGWPLNCEVIEGGELPAPCARAMKDGFNAAIKFRERVYRHIEKQNGRTMRNMMRAFDRFMEATEPPSGESLEDQITAAILRSEFEEIREQWSPIFESLHAGEGITVDLRELWPFKPTEATERRER